MNNRIIVDNAGITEETNHRQQLGLRLGRLRVILPEDCRIEALAPGGDGSRCLGLLWEDPHWTTIGINEKTLNSAERSVIISCYDLGKAGSIIPSIKHGR